MIDWWSEDTAILIGAIGGPAIGIVYGGIGGALAGYLASKGKAKNFVLAVLASGIALGVLSAIAGITALATSQPYHVYYPLLLIGVILTVLMGSLTPTFLHVYRQTEQRKLNATLAR